jgi:hypothetical protein
MSFDLSLSESSSFRACFFERSPIHDSWITISESPRDVIQDRVAILSAIADRRAQISGGVGLMGQSSRLPDSTISLSSHRESENVNAPTLLRDSNPTMNSASQSVWLVELERVENVAGNPPIARLDWCIIFSLRGERCENLCPLGDILCCYLHEVKRPEIGWP